MTQLALRRTHPLVVLRWLGQCSAKEQGAVDGPLSGCTMDKLCPRAPNVISHFHLCKSRHHRMNCRSVRILTGSRCESRCPIRPRPSPSRGWLPGAVGRLRSFEWGEGGGGGGGSDQMPDCLFCGGRREGSGHDVAHILFRSTRHGPFLAIGICPASPSVQLEARVGAYRGVVQSLSAAPEDRWQSGREPLWACLPLGQEEKLTP